MSKKESVDAASMHPIVHTPGPWECEHMHTAICKESQTLARVYHGEGRAHAENVANAKLIAAAPELLAACQLVSLWMLGGQPGPHSDSIVLEQVKSAIRKATS